MLWDVADENINPLNMPEFAIQSPPTQMKLPTTEPADVSKNIKEQELGNQIRIIWTSDKQNLAQKQYKNVPLSDYKSGAGNNKLL